MKIALLHGAIINAGDFLIKNRAIALLKYFYPDSEIVEYYRNQSLEEKLPEINACDILVFAGGPGYCNGFYPRMAPVTDDLNKIKIPVMLLGMGWWEHNSDVVSQYSYQFEEPMRALFQKATEKGLKMGCRDIATVNVLRNNGYDNIAMTGCPAWYDLEHIGIARYIGKGLTTCRKICISDCGNMANWGLAVELVQFVRRFFGNCEIYLVCHRGFPDARLGIEPIMKELNVHFMDISVYISDFVYMPTSITFPEETSPFYWKKMQEEAVLTQPWVCLRLRQSIFRQKMEHYSTISMIR